MPEGRGLCLSIEGPGALPVRLASTLPGAGKVELVSGVDKKAGIFYCMWTFTYMRIEHKPTEVRRLEIIEAAQKIILTRGIGHLTIEAIAQEVGLTEGAIYRHFTSKQEVLLFLLDDVERSLFEKLEEAKEVQGSSLTRLEELLKADLSYLEGREGLSFIISQAGYLGDPEIRDRVSRIVVRYLRTIEIILGEGVESGEIRHDIDRAAAAILFLGMVQGCVTATSSQAIADQGLVRRYLPLWNVYREAVVSRDCAA